MLRNMIKLGVLGIVVGCSIQASSHYMNEMVLELERRQPTITDAIIKQQVQESLKEAEAEIEKVQKEQNIVIQQEDVAIKPAKPPKEEKPKEEVAVPEQEVAQNEEPVTGQESTGAGNQLTSINLAAYSELTEAELNEVINYLIDHYFLYGYDYYSKETDPVRFERKKLASDMEDPIIKSIAKMKDLMGSLTRLKASDIKPILDEALMLRDQFNASYSNVGTKGKEFQDIYEAGMKYFDTYIYGVTKAHETFITIETSTNKALVLPMMLKTINQDILPAIREVLNQGFAMKEKTNKIYIEGLEGVTILTPADVVAIINDPTLALGKTTGGEQPKEEQPKEEEPKEEEPKEEEPKEEEPKEEQPNEEVPGESVPPTVEQPTEDVQPEEEQPTEEVPQEPVQPYDKGPLTPSLPYS